MRREKQVWREGEAGEGGYDEVYVMWKQKWRPTAGKKWTSKRRLRSEENSKGANKNKIKGKDPPASVSWGVGLKVCTTTIWLT